MFDIFTTDADGSTQVVVSVRYLTQAQEMACQLSCLFRGEYFGYFERIENVKPVATWEVEDGHFSIAYGATCGLQSGYARSN